MSCVFFIRHAETEMAGRFCGQSDPDLNTRGIAQLKGLAHLLRPETIDLVCSSDLRRAKSTAHAIAADRKIPVVLHPALREIDFGEWEGLSWKQIEQIDPIYARKWMTGYPHLPAPSGESFKAFEERILREVNNLLDSHHGQVAVVTHAGVIRVALRHLCGCSNEEAWQHTRPYCCVVRYDYAGKLPGQLPATQPFHVLSAGDRLPNQTVWSNTWRRLTQPLIGKRD